MIDTVKKISWMIQGQKFEIHRDVTSYELEFKIDSVRRDNFVTRYFDAKAGRTFYSYFASHRAIYLSCNPTAVRVTNERGN